LEVVEAIYRCFEDQADEGVGPGTGPFPGPCQAKGGDAIAIRTGGPVLGWLGRLADAEDLLELIDDQQEPLARREHRPTVVGPRPS
jgi:hypothetical protein